MSEISPVKSAERTVRILETLAASPTRLTLAELQAKMGYPRSSLHALVRTLRELRWVESEARFDVVTLPFTLLISLARPLREVLGAPVACTDYF